MSEAITSHLAEQIRSQCGENVFLCYQCQKCSSGCPVAEHFDLAPNQFMRAIQLGWKETVLKSSTLWLCAMCETCAVRCPHDINITKIMDVLKIMAQKEGLSSPLPAAVLFNQAAMRGIGLFGRMYEAGLMGEIYLRQLLSGTLNVRQLVKRDLPLAMHMIKKGKLKLLPSFGKPKIPVKTAKEEKGSPIIRDAASTAHQVSITLPSRRCFPGLTSHSWNRKTGIAAGARPRTRRIAIFPCCFP